MGAELKYPETVTVRSSVMLLLSLGNDRFWPDSGEP